MNSALSSFGQSSLGNNTPTDSSDVVSNLNLIFNELRIFHQLINKFPQSVRVQLVQDLQETSLQILVKISSQ